MKGLAVFRWLTPAALAALLSIPAQSVWAHPMGGGHGMGGMGGGGMRGRPAMASHFSNHNTMNRFAHRSSLDHHFNGFVDRRDHSLDRRDQFRDSHGLPDRSLDRRDQFRDNHVFRRNFFVQRNFFFRHNFFVGFDFAAFGFPWWGPWGPWWWYPDYGYDYSDYPDYADDSAGSGSQYSDSGNSGSEYDAQYWDTLAKAVQSKLAEQGYYHGEADGVLGSGSIQAIRQFQANHGLTVTGKIDPKLLKALGVGYKTQS